MVTTSRRYPPKTLTSAAAAALRAVHVTDSDAQLVAETLVAADRRGIYSHGLSRLPLYVAALQAGGMNAAPRLMWLRDDAATATLDADGALGQVAMRAATARAIELARRYGIAAVTVQNSTH